jgi:hypothetical protein
MGWNEVRAARGKVYTKFGQQTVEAAVAGSAWTFSWQHTTQQQAQPERDAIFHGRAVTGAAWSL